MSDWRDSIGPSLDTFGLGGLSDGDSLTVQFRNEGEMRDTENGEALSIHVKVTGVDATLTTMDGDEVEEGEEYYLMSSSVRFQRALAGFADRLKAKVATINVAGAEYERQYSVEGE